MPDSVLQRWLPWAEELPSVKLHPIPRKYPTLTWNTNYITLHGFSDASNLALGAVVYARFQQPDGTVTSNIIMARAKVCPVKRRSIPKLELEAAVILTKLLYYLATILHLSTNQLQPWTDSEIVLAWLRKMPCRLETFVANRTSFILEALPESSWRHVPTHKPCRHSKSRFISNRSNSIISVVEGTSLAHSTSIYMATYQTTTTDPPTPW